MIMIIIVIIISLSLCLIFRTSSSAGLCFQITKVVKSWLFLVLTQKDQAEGGVGPRDVRNTGQNPGGPALIPTSSIF